MKPFLKWAGNKYKIINRIRKVLPRNARLIEPFVGAGAVFLNTKYPSYLLADSNFDLINLYKYLQREKKCFIEYCSGFFGKEQNTEKVYIKNKELFNRTNDMRLKAALFLYLNKHCFNGLMRFNSKGVFNVSFGRHKKPYFPQKEMLFSSHKLTTARVYHENFIVTMNKARYGDVVYCDPPYVSFSKTSGFKQYGASVFGLKEQLSLVKMAEKLIKRGSVMIISNHDTLFVNNVYKMAVVSKFDVQRFISCNGNNRFQVGEVLAVFL